MISVDNPGENLAANDYIYLASWAGAYASKHGISGIDIAKSAAEPEQSTLVM